MYTKKEMLDIIDAEGNFESFNIEVKNNDNRENAIYKCFINRYKRDDVIGGWCGYVCLDEKHPLFRKESGFPDCHGGITYHRMGAEWPDEYNFDTTGFWVVGFDCSHEWDIVPYQILREYDAHLVVFEPYQQYRTKSYVKKEVEKLAYSLHSVCNNKN